MAQYLQTNGNYTVKTVDGGIIKLDVGPPSGGGQVIITANLVVEGDTLTVEAENLNVKDNIIQLNYGETGAGVSLRYSGLQVDRGTEAPASFFWDENDDSFNLATGSPESTFNYNSTLRLKKITTDTSSPNLILIGYGDGVISVEGTNNYENQVTENYHIPNKKYVDDSIRDNPTFQIIDDNTRVIVTDKEVSGSLAYLTANTGYSSFGESAVSVVVDGYLNSQFYSNRTIIQNLEFNDNEITNDNTNGNIFLRTQGTGKVQTNYGFEIENIAGTPADVADTSILYAKTPSTGKSGLYSVNSIETQLNNNDVGARELVNKNRALLFSMIF